MYKGIVIDKCKEYDILEFETCGFIHIDPIPTPEELDRLYKGKHYSFEQPDYLGRAREIIILGRRQ